MEVVQYKCPNCSASLEFDAVTQRFHCAYCFSSFTHEEMEKLFRHNEEHPLDIAEPEQSEEDKKIEEFGGGNNLYVCPNCGASIMTDETTAATSCYYCHSPVMLTGRLSGEYRPRYVIPFKTSKEQAQEKFRVWCGSKRFVPKGFKSIENAEKIEGIYIPYWLADCRLRLRLNGTAKISSSTRSGDYNVTHTKEYSVQREGEMFFMGVPCDGSSKAANMLMENIEPYDYKELEDFSMSYLSGHLAEKFDVTKEMVQPDIEKRIRDAGKAEILKTVTGYSSVSVTNEEYDTGKLGWQYALLPVWFLSYTYKGKEYCFAMNGQTGKFSGDLPVLKGLLRTLFILLGLGIFLIFGLIGGFMVLC